MNFSDIIHSILVLVAILCATATFKSCVDKEVSAKCYKDTQRQECFK